MLNICSQENSATGHTLLGCGRKENQPHIKHSPFVFVSNSGTNLEELFYSTQTSVCFHHFFIWLCLLFYTENKKITADNSRSLVLKCSNLTTYHLLHPQPPRGAFLLYLVYAFSSHLFFFSFSFYSTFAATIHIG